MRNKTVTNLTIIIIILASCLILSSIFNDALITAYKEQREYTKTCICNHSIITTMNYTVSEVRGFYKYNDSNINYDLSLAKLKTEGGVCRHYAEHYIDIALKNGFNATTIVFPMGDGFHEIALASDRSSYCVLDQDDYWCKELDV